MYSQMLINFNRFNIIDFYHFRIYVFFFNDEKELNKNSKVSGVHKQIYIF